jgi:hypothetical protein
MRFSAAAAAFCYTGEMTRQQTVAGRLARVRRNTTLPKTRKQNAT